MKSVAASTIGSTIEVGQGSALQAERVHAGAEVTRRPPPAAVDSPAMPRLTDPVYRRRALEFGADALLAAAAFALAFKLRFLDDGGDPGSLRDDAARLDRVRRARQGARDRALRPAPAVVALLPAS